MKVLNINKNLADPILFLEDVINQVKTLQEERNNKFKILCIIVEEELETGLSWNHPIIASSGTNAQTLWDLEMSKKSLLDINNE